MSETGRRDPAVRAAYDAVAAEYDRQVEGDAWMRRILWRQYDGAFVPGHHVLDVGCGTGTDAVHLARRGIRVTAIDSSPAMIDRAQAKIVREGVASDVRVAVLDIGDLSVLPPAAFDGIISSFAALNTLPTLAEYAVDASRLLRPGGRMILHLLAGSSLREWIGLVAHSGWAEARDLSGLRERTFLVGGEPVVHHLPRAGEAYSHYFAPYFRLRRAYALGITRPPQELKGLPPGVASALGRLDDLIGKHRPFVDWGRFLVLDLVSDIRRPEVGRVRNNARHGS